MSLAIEKILVPATGRPVQPSGNEADQKLNISVVFTSVESTLAALRKQAPSRTAWAREFSWWYLKWCHTPSPSKVRRSWWSSARNAFGWLQPKAWWKPACKFIYAAIVSKR